MTSGKTTVRGVIANLRKVVALERDALSLEIVYELSKRPPLGTPVRTGWAKANWTPVLGAPDLSPVASKGDAAIAAARQQSAIAQLVASGANRPEDPVHVYNPAPYVARLNGVSSTDDDGIERAHSGQSAPGWVERSVDRAVTTRSARVKSNRGKL